MIVEVPRSRSDTPVSRHGRPRLRGIGLRCSAFDVDGDVSASRVHGPHHELIYVARGEGELHLGSQCVPAKSGDVFVLSADALHVVKDPARWRTWILSFRSEAIDGSVLPRVMSLLEAGGPSRASVPEQERSRWETRFSNLLNELCSHGGDAGGSVRAALGSILLDMLRCTRHGEHKALSRVAVLEAVFRYIDAHYRSSITLRDVAAVVHFSPAYLTDMVRRETGRPIHQWIAERRLDSAKCLLAETDRPIAEIAEEAGFRDTSYFGRHFSKITGQTPRSWRATQRRDYLSSSGLKTHAR